MGMGAQESGTRTVTQDISPYAEQFGRENLALADALSQRPFDAYQGQRIAPFSADTLQAFEQVRGLTPQGGGHGVTSDIARNFTPQTIDPAQIGRGDIRDVQAGMFTDADIGAYMNPYENTVVANTAADMARAFGQQQNAERARAAAAGAFGGGRSALLEAENQRNYLDRLGSTLGGLRYGGYQQAQNVIGQDLNRAFQGDLANQSMDWNTASANAQMAQQAALQTAANQLSGAGLRLDAAGQMGQLGTQNIANQLTLANALTGIGGATQGMDQANLDLAYDDFLRQQAYPAEMLNMRLSALQSTPYGSRTTQPIFSNPGAGGIGAGLSLLGMVPSFATAGLIPGLGGGGGNVAQIPT